MGLIDVLSLSYPASTLKQELFHAKVFSFFSYSISNMLGLIFGALIISLVLHTQGASVDSIAVYFMMTAAIALSVFFCLYMLRKKSRQLNYFINCLSCGLSWAAELA